MTQLPQQEVFRLQSKAEKVSARFGNDACRWRLRDLDRAPSDDVADDVTSPWQPPHCISISRVSTQ